MREYFRLSLMNNLRYFTLVMPFFTRNCILLTGLLVVAASCSKSKVDFSADVKPILNKHCISCHGGVKQNGGFSVLFREEALDTTESGKYAIVPGHPENSEMIRRLTSSDPEERMPYKKEPLAAKEIEILEKWIVQGAEWGDHWAYKPPLQGQRRAQKVLTRSAKNEGSFQIDELVREKLGELNIPEGKQADRAMLVRRVHLDVIGIPPTIEQAQAFIADTSPDAYERMVNHLLESRHFGEKWASWWLDLARYADTKGYERDVYRNAWRYRDWVIKAFNTDMPFDQFTIEQLAGDMLPNPSDDQLIATAFHRNTMNNDEGGTEDEEFRVAALFDRVATTWEVWQGTTMACVQCHSHPYDPIRHEEYYRALAIFNNTRDEDSEGEHPNLRLYSPEDEKQIESVRQWVLKHSDESKNFETNRFLKTLEPKYHPHDFDQFVNGELIDTKWLGIRSGGSARLRNIELDDVNVLYINYWAGSDGGMINIHADALEGPNIGSVRIDKTSGRKVIPISIRSMAGRHDLYFRFVNSKIKPTESVCGIEWFAFRDDLPGKSAPGFQSVNTNFTRLLNAKVDNVPVTIENGPLQKRKTQVFERGNWLVKGKEVQPGVPKALSSGSQITDRLSFSRWLVSEQNPLTARVIVNRIWEQIFGAGLVETLEDFGSQGSAPMNAELLDMLALRLMADNQWSIKKTIRDILLSETYRRDSNVSRESLERDPQNRYLGRAPRIRLSAEQVRDQALLVSGLLSEKMYGPSVMPYQPEGIWQTVWSGAAWKESAGEDAHRRTVYTFVKRTSPYPSMMMFDGSSREVCVGRRIRTNTPLQALVTLNDSVFVEASIHFAKRMTAAGASTNERVRKGYEMLMFKPISQTKEDVLVKLYSDAVAEFRAQPARVTELIGGTSTDPELAGMVVVANALLNLDEVITKE